MVTCNTAAIADWLIDGARSAEKSQDVLAAMCDHLVDCGIPLWRAAVFVRTLHPHVTGRRFLWRVGHGVDVSELLFEGLQTAEFQDSPVARVYACGTPIRRRFVGSHDVADFSVLRDLRAEGVSDYLASPLKFTDGSIHVATWATRHPDGFANEHIAGIEAIVAPLTRVAEIRALTRTASNLLNTYVGRNTGERILSGQIQRGHTEAIHAAIWLSDMRGFTALADQLPPQALTDLLNRYFDCQVPAIVDRGGEVLKFIGDGLLAIFPVAGNQMDTRSVCGNALAAAFDVRANIAKLGSAAGIEGVDDVRFGLALHLGDVLYGNIGGGNRLDFTCIGPAVNLAARLEKLAGRLGESVLASAAFARHCDAPLRSIGEFTLPGSSSAQTIYGLGDAVRHNPAPHDAF
jgi:adenylate cyclase